MLLVRGLLSARTWLGFTHLVAGVFVGLAAFFIVPMTILGVLFLPLGLVGLPVLGLGLRLADGLAVVERARFDVLLGKPITPHPADDRRGYRWLLIPRRVTAVGRVTRGELGYAVARLPLSLILAALALAVWTAGSLLVALPLYAGQLPPGSVKIDGLAPRGPLALTVSVVNGLILLVLAAPPVTRGLTRADAGFARLLLAPGNSGLAARVSELEISRERVVDAAEAERRRIERDLHDGAQQRLVALAMELGRAQARFADGDIDAARDLVDQAHGEAKAALSERRDLVRGVHPPVLTDRGLDAALSGLAARCPVPVDMRVDVPVRPKAAVEAVAYFMVAEALTNVAEHAGASQVTVVVERRGRTGPLTVMIIDDGIGGADPDGPGLSGLSGRVAGVDGSLAVESPPGGPTIISAVLPCG